MYICFFPGFKGLNDRKTSLSAPATIVKEDDGTTWGIAEFYHRVKFTFNSSG
jgi:hypothetical protein